MNHVGIIRFSMSLSTQFPRLKISLISLNETVLYLLQEKSSKGEEARSLVTAHTVNQIPLGSDQVFPIRI